MTSRDFCYWLQGYLEIQQKGEPDKMPSLTGAQVECLRKHLAMVFKHEIDPSYGDKKKQDALNALHTDQPGGDVLYRC